MDGLLEGLDVALRLLALVLEALVRFAATVLGGFRMFFGVLFGWGHGAFLCSVCDAMSDAKETMHHGGWHCQAWYGAD